MRAAPSGTDTVYVVGSCFCWENPQMSQDPRCVQIGLVLDCFGPKWGQIASDDLRGCPWHGLSITNQSGLGVISVWGCDMNRVERELGDIGRQVAMYGTQRLDTAGECGGGP